MPGDSGKTEAKEIGIVLGKLEGIQHSQERMDSKIQMVADHVSEIRTSVALIQHKIDDHQKRLDAHDIEIGQSKRAIAGVRGSWKMALVKYGSTAVGGGGAIAWLLKILGVKLGGAGE